MINRMVTWIFLLLGVARFVDMKRCPNDCFKLGLGHIRGLGIDNQIEGLL